MSRYNAWQNKGLRKIVEAMDDDALREDRGAFFGSIFATLNHLLWGDQLWMSRFDGGDAPTVGIPESTAYKANAVDWALARFQTDARITTWADGLHSVDLVGDLSWYSGAMQRDMVKSKQECIVHFFNHQTHHRGQVHAMLTAAGQKPTDTDIPFMPDT
ncbi:DinB family protein [Yoonia sp. 208BN28-4]|uniref:DinB family protein n=1 Tax=Yoonia sp. 208BN28-4 TaxID=3126505 RepID=UPI0030A811B4